MMMTVPGTGDVLVPKACQRTLAIFDGRMRYDLRLAYKRMDKVMARTGYQGAVVVCSVQFSPIAGHVPERPMIKYLASQGDMELWLRTGRRNASDDPLSGPGSDAYGTWRAGGDAVRCKTCRVVFPLLTVQRPALTCLCAPQFAFEKNDYRGQFAPRATSRQFSVAPLSLRPRAVIVFPI